MHKSYIKLIHTVSFAILCCLLFACGEHKKIANDLSDYSERLQNYTGIDIAPNSTDLGLDAPSKASLKLEVDSLSINLREFYAFNTCSLNQLVAQRNTALGKMQLPSSRFAYESELIVELAKCQQLSQDEKPELVAKLSEWAEIKKEQLPYVWSNLLSQSNETYRHFTANSGYISGNNSDAFQATKQALTFLLKSKNLNNHPVDISALELHLQQLDNAPLLSRIWRTQILLQQKLDSISTLLTSYLDSNSCKNVKEEESIEIMRNIFRIFFAERIQPVAAELNNYYYRLSPLIEQIIASPELPQAFKDYLFKHNTTNFQAYTGAMQSHIKLWQQIFGRCDAQ